MTTLVPLIFATAFLQQSPANQAPTPSETYRPGQGVTAPVLLRETKPNYTAEAMRARIQGIVTLECVVMPDGSVQEVRGLAWRSDNCPVPPSRLDETLDERGLQRRGKVGQAEAALVRALDLWSVRREHLMDVCPTCAIRPQIDVGAT